MFKDLNPILHSQLRLAIMSLLISVEDADFVYLREQTGATAGNLSVQIDKLREAGYINVEKTFQGKMPRTVCRMNPAGADAFNEYANALQEYLDRSRRFNSQQKQDIQ
jgi:DNA-binding MarR family transcriptional regulator